MKETTDVSLGTVRESYTLLNKNSFNNICFKKDSNKSLK